MLVVTIMLLMMIITSEIINNVNDNDEDVIMMAIISASDYEGNENEIAVKAMAIQRMAPVASVHLFPFVRWRRVQFPSQSTTTFRSGVIQCMPT